MQGRQIDFISLVLGLCTPLIAGLALAQFTPNPETHPDQLWLAQPHRVSAYAPYTDSLRASLPIQNIRAVATDTATGNFWVIGREGLAGFTAQGELVTGPVDLSLESPHVVRLLSDSEAENVWIVHDAGWSRYHTDGTFQASWESPEPVHDAALGIRDGRLLLLSDAGLHEFNAAGQTSSAPLPLPVPATRMAIDPVTRELWLAADDGLLRMAESGGFSDPYESPLQQLRDIQADGVGGVWLADNHRVVRLNRSGETIVDVEPWHQQGGGIGNAVIVSLAAHAGEQSVWVVNVQSYRRISANGELGPARDILDHSAAIRSAVLHADFTPPQVAIVKPEPEIFTNDNRHPIDLEYSEYGSAVATDSISLALGGSVFEADCEATQTEASCRPVNGLEDGYHTLTATVADLAGNVSVPASLRFTIDTIPPVITVTSPENDLHTRDEHVTLRGHISEMPVHFEIDDEVVPVEYWTFNKEVSLTEGENRFSLKATDRAERRLPVDAHHT